MLHDYIYCVSNTQFCTILCIISIGTVGELVEAEEERFTHETEVSRVCRIGIVR